MTASRGGELRRRRADGRLSGLVGGFVAEPVHWMLFVLFWLSLALAALWYRFR
jgi:hypothetical protein